MIDQLLDLTRVRLGGGLQLSRSDAHLGSVVDQVLSETTIARGRFQLETTGDLKGSWDVDRLFQVVTNLACNAAEHSPPEAKIRVSLDGRAADVVKLAVHNLGPAIPRDLQPILFEPFRGSKQRKTGNAQGLGLGLFITQQLVLAHGGALDFESSDEAGTVFTLTLPRTEKEREKGTRFRPAWR